MIAHPAAARTDAGATPHPSVAALRAAGLLGATESLPEQPRDLSRAHGVWAVRLPDGRRVVIKSAALTAPADAGGAEGSLGAELFVHRMAHWCPPLRDALPAPAVVDERAGLLVVDDVGAGQPASLALLADALGDDPALFGMLGARIGAVHRATARLPLPAATAPLVLQVLGGPAADPHRSAGTALLAASTREVVASLRARPDVVAAATRLRTPAGTSLVHHDLKWDNIAVTAGRAPVVVDWELAGAGDPAWDLGCLVAEHVLRTGGEVPPAGRALVRGYGDAARISPRATALFAERVALATILRVAQFALEVAERAAGGDLERAHALAALAVALRQRVADLTRELSSCLTR